MFCVVKELLRMDNAAHNSVCNKETKYFMQVLIISIVYTVGTSII